MTGFGGGGHGAGLMPSESFDLDIMMPPDIDAIESDISKTYSFYFNFGFIDKIGALTPN